ncbi:MAG: insulinase family protein, partial [Candidatus Eremiobacteraeota bacterium]|nr:insulinase family protein [Candidatus Eremiobacteraeota bacterium]
TLVVVGDVRTEDVFALAKAAFGGIASRRVPEHLAVVPVKSSAPQRVVQSAEFPFEIVDLAYPTPAGNTSAIYDLQNFSVVLGDERSAFFRDIVQAGTALAIFPNLEFHDRGGVFHVIMVLSPGKGVDAARAAFEGTLAKYVADGIPADLVNEARTRLVAQNLFEQDSLSSFAFELGHLYGVAGITFARDTELTAAVTPASVVAAAKRYMSVPYVIGDLKPSGSKIEGIAPPTSASGVSDNFGARSPEGELVLPQYAREAMAQRFVGRSSVDPTRFKVGGIDVLVQPVKDASTVLMRGDLRSSPVMDPVGREGLYDIATGLMSYGGEKVPFETMQAKLGSLGAELRVGSSIRGRMLSKDFETVIGLMAESLREPAFPQKYLDVAMRQERDSIGRLDTLPDYQARRTTLELLLPKNDPELRRPSLESLANISRADLVSEARKYVRPDYLSLAFVGDVTPERVRRALETSFAGWQGEGPVVDTNLPPIPDPKAAAKLIPSHEKVVHVSVTMRAPARGDADYDALWIAAMLLGGASDSRLMGELRGKLGLVYNISAKVDSGIDRGTVAFEFTAAPQNVRKALTVLKSEVRRISEETPRASELFGVRRAVIARAFVNQQSFAEVGDDILKIATDGLPRDYYATLDQRFGNIAPAQVKAAARRYLSPDHWIEVYSGPSGW